MSEPVPNILLLEDTRTVQNYVKDILRSLPGGCRIHTARKIDEAMRIVSSHEISLSIVDIGLPDGDGFDFLSTIAAMQPASKALIITSTPREDYRDRAKNLGVISFLTKPIHRKELLDATTHLLKNTEPVGDEEAPLPPHGFEGTLGGLSPADIVQLKCLSHSTGKIEFTTEDRFGYIWFENGEVCHAVAEHVNGSYTGTEAFQFIVSWHTGTVREVHCEPDYPHTVSRSWQSLLMDATEASMCALASA